MTALLLGAPGITAVRAAGAVRSQLAGVAIAATNAATNAARPVVESGYLTGQRVVLAFGTLPPGSSASLHTAQNWVEGVGALVAVVSLIIVGIGMMGSHHDGSGRTHGNKLVKVFGGLLLISSASAIVSALLP